MLRLMFNPIGDSYALVALAALAMVALLSIAPRRSSLGPRRRVAIGALRLVVIAMVVLVMLRPALVYTETKQQSATLVVLVDRSRSMSVADGVAGKTRWECLRDALEGASGALATLAERFEVRADGFDAETRPLPVRGGQIALDTMPDGPQTAIGAALADVLRREAGKRLLGVVLLSDGAQRALAPRDLAPQTAAAQMKMLGAPLWAVPFGQSRGLGQAQDVAVTDLVVAESVFVNNALEVAGQVRIDGYINRPVPVRLLWETSPGKMETVAEVELSATAGGQLLPVRFRHVPAQTGEFKLALEAAEQPGELVTTNNALATFVSVLGGGLRVLYVEGELRPESKFLRRALDASPDIHVDYVRLDPRDPAARPADLAERVAPGKYEVYLLGDLDSSAWSQAELKQLAEAVDRGAGLAMIGGFHSFGPGGYGETPLGAVLPVVMDRFERQALGEPVREDLHVPGPLTMRPTAVGLLHFALNLAADRGENLAAWAKLPPLEGANRFQRFAPGAVVLAEGYSPENPSKTAPLLVAQSFGQGRVIAFAGDSTWRWWMQGHASAHKRFWRQIVLWLARKEQTTEGAVWIKLPKRRFAPAERVELSAGARAATGEALADADYDIHVLLPDGSKLPLRAARQGETVVASLRELLAPGDYAVEVDVTHQGRPVGSARARFLVYQQDLELDNAAADAALLDSLAAMTGGELVAPEQLPRLVERIAGAADVLEVQQETKKTLWDTWPMLLAIVGALSVEWYLRKRWGLV